MKNIIKHVFKKKYLTDGQRQVLLFNRKIFSYMGPTGPMYRNREVRRYSAPGGFNRMLVDNFKHQTGLLPNEDLTKFTHKVAWTMMFGRSKLKSMCADKLAVRDYVTQKIGDKYLIKHLAVYDKPDQLDLSALPETFMLKCNNGSKMYKKITPEISAANIKQLMREWLNSCYWSHYLEMHYFPIRNRIFAEELVEMQSECEYKFFCFHGKVGYVQAISYVRGPGKNGTKFFDKDWNEQDFYTSSYKIESDIPRPKQMDEMIKLAEILATDFDFVRVDFYLLKDGSIKFGELTFTPTAGDTKFHPESANEKMGALWHLDNDYDVMTDNMKFD